MNIRIFMGLCLSSLEPLHLTSVCMFSCFGQQLSMVPCTAPDNPCSTPASVTWTLLNFGFQAQEGSSCFPVSGLTPLVPFRVTHIITGLPFFEWPNRTFWCTYRVSVCINLTVGTQAVSASWSGSVNNVVHTGEVGIPWLSLFYLANPAKRLLN